MANIQVPKDWELKETQATPEAVYFSRRRLLKIGGGTALGALAAGALFASGTKKDLEGVSGAADTEHTYAPLPAERNPAYSLDRPVTPEEISAAYNNFYEFSTGKSGIARLSRDLVIDPWSVKVKGVKGGEKIFDLDELIAKMPVEERLYRFRCVEAWAMAVPWIGIPMSEFIKAVEPESSAKFVAMRTFHRPKEAPEQARRKQYPWPYQEGLTMDEAMNELTLLAVGIYGKRMPRQHGAPIRLIVPWKYGFKSAKSIVEIEFLETQPKTFWNTLIPREYGFTANVNPEVPHPRWSQATERMIDTGERRDTLPYNGYGEQVATLYG